MPRAKDSEQADFLDSWWYVNGRRKRARDLTASDAQWLAADFARQATEDLKVAARTDEVIARRKERGDDDA